MTQTQPLAIMPGYFNKAVDDVDGVIERAKQHLATVDFDTFVATGLSGTCMATVLAHAMGKHFLILRKHDDHSTHDGNRAVGRLGERWLFLDDFVSSGATRRRVHEQMSELLTRHGDTVEWDDSVGDYRATSTHQTTYVGDYHYARNDGQFVPAYRIDLESSFPTW